MGARRRAQAVNPGGEVMDGSALEGEGDDVRTLGDGPNVRRGEARIGRAHGDADSGATEDGGESGV